MIHNYWKCFQRMQFLDSRFRSMSTFSRFLKWYRDLWESSPVAPKPPYVHVCQIGDPILRSKAEQVRPDVIKTDDLQKV